MRTRTTFVITTIIAALLLAAAPVSAAGGPDAVAIELDVTFPTEAESGHEEFVTRSGRFCPSGYADSETLGVAGRGALVFFVAKTFVCDDGSGSVSIMLQATTSARFDGTTGGWRVTGGTGAWSRARGGGQITGMSTATGIQDTYRGTIKR